MKFWRKVPKNWLIIDMEVKLNLSKEEHKELVAYCNLNDLLISSVVKDSFTTGFNIERYGLLNSNVGKEKVIEKEVIKEKRIEIPVEVIKEVLKIEYVEVEKPVDKIVEKIIEKPVEIIKEVPVEKVVEKVIEVTKEIPVEKVIIKEVIKEVPVEKVVYVTDQQELNEKIFQKEQDFEAERKKFSSKLQEQENIFQKDKLDLLSKIKELESKEPQIIETIREVPVEKIVEVIKEVVLEKEGNGVDKAKFDALQTTLLKLRQETLEKDRLIKQYENTIQEIQTFQKEKKAIYLSGSNLDKKLLK